MQYDDMIIEVSDAELVRTTDKSRMGRFKVRVLSSPVGEMKPEEAVPVEYDDGQLQDSLRQLESRSLDRFSLIALGRELARMLLPFKQEGAATGVRDLLAASLNRVGPDRGIRLRLGLPPLLEMLPWEYVYVDRVGGSQGIEGFLALDPHVGIVYRRARATTEISVQQHIQEVYGEVTGVQADHLSFGQIDVNQEVTVVQGGGEVIGVRIGNREGDYVARDKVIIIQMYQEAMREVLEDVLSDEELNTLDRDPYCNEPRRLLRETKRRNPSNYMRFISRQARRPIGLQDHPIPDVQMSVQAIQREYGELRQSTASYQEIQIDEDFQFRNRYVGCAEIIFSDGNHIWLYGPGGAGKTYLLKHLEPTAREVTRRDDIRCVYIDLTEHGDAEDILREAVRQLSSGLEPPEPTRPGHLAEAICFLHRPGDDTPPVNHVLFLFDSATEQHRAVIDWLISPEGLINHSLFRRTLVALGIQESVRLQVVIAAQHPIVRLSDYHSNLRPDEIRIRPLEKKRQDPIYAMLRELVDRREFPMPPNICRQIGDQIYYLTGGHPRCAKSLLLAVANRGFAMPTREDWRNLFSTHVLPLIQREMLGSIRDLDLLSAFWVLSVFRRFDQGVLNVLLQRGILPRTSSGQDYARDARRLRAKLVGTYLVNDSATRGEGCYCTMNSMIRRVLSQSMQYHSPERYQTLNSIALEIFTERLQVTSKSPERSIVSLIEIVYHWFKALEMDPTVEVDHICNRVQEALGQSLPLLLITSDEDDLLDVFPWFQGIWREDEELQETARLVTGGTGCHEALSRQVEKFAGERIRQQFENGG